MVAIVPNLIHKVAIEIRQIDRGATAQDPDAREPIQQAARDATVTVLGQPRSASRIQKGHDRGGSTEGTTGYVLFRLVDLDALGIELQQNDRIKKIGSVDFDVYIERLEFTGHYDDGPTLVKAHYRDRQPGKQLRGS